MNSLDYFSSKPTVTSDLQTIECRSWYSCFFSSSLDHKTKMFACLLSIGSIHFWNRVITADKDDQRFSEVNFSNFIGKLIFIKFSLDSFEMKMLIIQILVPNDLLHPKQLMRLSILFSLHLHFIHHLFNRFKRIFNVEFVI